MKELNLLAFYIILSLAFVLVVSLIFVTPLKAYGQNDNDNDNATADLPPGVVIDNRYGAVHAGDYIIQLKDSTPLNFVDDEAMKVQEELKEQGGNVSQIYTNTIKGFAVKNVSDLSVLLDDPNIATIEPDKLIVANTQYRSHGVVRLGGMEMDGTYKIDGREGKPNIDIAVIDTRIWIVHPDLNLFRNVDIIPSSQSADRNTIHGIHVAGIAAARDNLAGTVGIIPGARIWSISVMKASGGASSDIIAGIDYVRANAASIEIATMSLGCDLDTGSCPIGSAENNAITSLVNAGVTLFVGAGNDGKNADNTAYCGADSAICVSALTDNDGKCGGAGGSTDDRRATYSNYGSDVDIMTPGTSILSLSSGIPSLDPNFLPTLPYIGSSPYGGYAQLSGTSMATPFAAGIGAIIKLNNPSFTPAQVKSNLLSNGYIQTQSCAGSKGGLASGANSDSSERLAWAGNY